MGFLSDKVEDVRRRLERNPIDESKLMGLAIGLPPTRGFAGALWSAQGSAVIAEVKRASPSAGAIAETDPAERAREYERAGAVAISVLTEPVHFDGSLADLRAVHLATTVPVLRKDFLVHPDQVLEARAAGADTVLLISSCLSDDELVTMLATARGLGMEPLVETHTDEDLERVLATDAEVVGINARDLESLVVDVPAARARLARIGADRVAVLESGIRSRSDVSAAVAAGASAILVGETLMRATDPGATLQELIHGKETR